MALRATKPTPEQTRLKLFLFGPAGVGKTTAAIQFPRPYIIDAEKGTAHYDALINAAKGAVFRSTDISEVTMEVKSLLTEKHDYRTLVLDPITPLYDDLLERAEQKVGTDFGRHYGEANKAMKRLVNMVMRLDMNVVITAHAKNMYGKKLEVIGSTFDGWKRLDYIFDLVLELQRSGTKRVANVRKTRLSGFVDGTDFDFSYAEVAKRCDPTVVTDSAAKVITLATSEEVAELNKLLEVVKLPDGTLEKWLDKAGADELADMTGEQIQKCIDHVKKKITAPSTKE